MIKHNKKLFLSIFNILEPVFFATSLFAIFVLVFVPIWLVMLHFELNPFFWLIPFLIGFVTQIYWSFTWIDVMRWVKEEIQEEDDG